MLGQTLPTMPTARPFTRRVLGRESFILSTLPMPPGLPWRKDTLLCHQFSGNGGSRTSWQEPDSIAVGRIQRNEQGYPITGNPATNLLRAGIYEVNGRLLAFNRPTRESSLETIAVGELDELIGSSHISWIGAEASKSIFKQAEIWRFFLVLMTVLLLAESFLGLPARKSKRAKSHAT